MGIFGIQAAWDFGSFLSKAADAEDENGLKDAANSFESFIANVGPLVIVKGFKILQLVLPSTEEMLSVLRSGNASQLQELFNLVSSNIGKLNNLRNLVGGDIPKLFNLLNLVGFDLAKLENLISLVGGDASKLESLLSLVGNKVARLESLISAVGDVPRLESLLSRVNGNVTKLEQLLRLVGNPVQLENLLIKVPNPNQLIALLWKVPNPVQLVNLLTKVPNPNQLIALLRKVPNPIQLESLLTKIPNLSTLEILLKYFPDAVYLEGNILQRSEVILNGNNIDGLNLLANELYPNKRNLRANPPLTNAGYSLTKHAPDQRGTSSNSPFPRLSGNNATINSIAEQQVREILYSTDTVFVKLGKGGIQAQLPDGRGIRFDADGKMGFIP